MEPSLEQLEQLRAKSLEQLAWSSLEQMDDLFGITDLVKQVETERDHSIDGGRKDPHTITEVEKV